ncbi:MAG: YadA C-terminal domain-containing protein, partial [Erythrobacter sp.]
AATTATNQVALGGAGSSVQVGDIDASTDAQVGPVDVVTVDANGTLGRQQAATMSSVQNVRVAVDQIAAVSDAQFDALSARTSTLEGRIDNFDFRLDDLDESTRGGIAAAMALGGTMVVPDSTFSVSFNASTYRGEQGFAGSVTARVGDKVYINGGVTGSTAKKSTGGRVGVAFGF